jgi:P27 family predicted phage terminase small subunit
MAGRRPKPTALKELTGNPGKRPLNLLQPRPQGLARCPAHLSAQAKSEWRRVAPELRRLGLLTTVDRAALAAYCTLWSLAVDAERQIQKLGLILFDEARAYKNPAVNVLKDVLAQMRLFATEFGMTPSSLSRIHVAQPNMTNRFDEFSRAAQYFESDPN